MNDPRAADAMRSYIVLMNEISSLGQQGFAALLDSASPDEMTQLIAAADVVRRSLERYRRR